jgi:predicted transcriptional regulator
MKIIQNEIMGFRCTNSLKQNLIEIADASDMHVSQVIRMACAELAFRRSQTGEKQARAWLTQTRAPM